MKKKKCRKCPECGIKTIPISDLDNFSVCSKCGSCYEISKFFSVSFSFICLFFVLFFIENNDKLISGLILIFLFFRHLNIDYFDGLFMPLKKLK